MAVMHTDVSEEANNLKRKWKESLTARNYLLRRLVRNRIFYRERHTCAGLLSIAIYRIAEQQKSGPGISQIIPSVVILFSKYPV